MALNRVTSTKQDDLSAALDKLLQWLHPDREFAGHRFEQLRSQIGRFFVANGVYDHDELVDEVMHRVGRKLLEGVAIDPERNFPYFRQVAHNLLHEWWRERNREQDLDSLLPHQLPILDPKIQDRERDREEWLKSAQTCLEKCLKEIDEDRKSIFLRYQEEVPGLTIEESRERLARELGIDITALRNRITRIRAKLETCVSRCIRIYRS